MSSASWELPRPAVGWELLRAILSHWAARFHPEMLVARELALRWDREKPASGVDPDVSVFPRRPPGDLAQRRSVCTWKEGHVAPIFAIEVVSDTEPRKDYANAPDKYGRRPR